MPYSTAQILNAVIPLIVLSALVSHTMAGDIDQLCEQIGNKLSSVSTQECHRQQLLSNGGHSHQQRPLAYKIYPPVKGNKSLGRVLLMGGIHGDEYSAVSILFKWMNTLNRFHSGRFHWQVIPLLNPDGLLHHRKAQRQNANGVDLNRNFPSSDWHQLALKYWRERTYKNPRRYPGAQPMSEPETQWFVDTIRRFKPDVIIAVHAPHRLVDYDGPLKAPAKLGNLQLRQLGIYPGSLGNYAGVDLNIPVVTVELASAGIMPSSTEITHMWVDLVGWLTREIPKHKRQTALKRPE
ncbi:MAG: murein peptide amidase A [Cellvibrionaceae bacterium]|nr:murein peptide amidase A [Cellvibrionaceae bacterium]